MAGAAGLPLSGTVAGCGCGIPLQARNAAHVRRQGHNDRTRDECAIAGRVDSADLAGRLADRSRPSEGNRATPSRTGSKREGHRSCAGAPGVQGRACSVRRIRGFGRHAEIVDRYGRRRPRHSAYSFRRKSRLFCRFCSRGRQRSGDANDTDGVSCVHYPGQRQHRHRRRRTRHRHRCRTRRY